MDIEWAASAISYAWAPLHELGHMVFGWLSLNPTIITGWAEAAITRDGFMVSIGGVLGEFLAIAAIPELLARRRKARPFIAIPAFMWLCTAISIPTLLHGDFPQGTPAIAYVLAFGTAALALIFMLYRRISWQTPSTTPTRRIPSSAPRTDSTPSASGNSSRAARNRT